MSKFLDKTFYKPAHSLFEKFIAENTVKAFIVAVDPVILEFEANGELKKDSSGKVIKNQGKGVYLTPKEEWEKHYEFFMESLLLEHQGRKYIFNLEWDPETRGETTSFKEYLGLHKLVEDADLQQLAVGPGTDEFSAFEDRISIPKRFISSEYILRYEKAFRFEGDPSCFEGAEGSLVREQGDESGQGDHEGLIALVKEFISKL